VAHHCIEYDKLSPNQQLTTTNTSTTSRGRITCIFLSMAVNYSRCVTQIIHSTNSVSKLNKRHSVRCTTSHCDYSDQT